MKSSRPSVALSDSDDQSPTAAGEDFADLFENAPCAYLSLRPDGRIAMANAAMSRWTGFSREELVGTRMRDIMPFAARIFLETHLLPLLRLQQTVDEVALDFVTKDGGKLPTLANASEHRDADGRHLSTRLILLKAVDRRLYERELATERDRAQEAITIGRQDAELREQFIAVLGHDLRNPLASIDSGVDLLRREGASPRASRVLDLMKGSVERAGSLIDNVLDFARGRLGGGITLERQAEAPLQPMLEQVVAELRAIAPDRAIDASFAIDRPVNCDATRIGQLASNLLGNALTHGASDQPVRFRVETSDDTLTLWVANGGKPIPAKTLGALFHPFFRGNASKSQQGLGLGLYIASQIAQAHGGELSAVSSPTETRFTFSMPLGATPR